jgi:CRISPR-associated protein Csh1
LVGEQGGSGWKQNGGSHFNKLYKSTLRGFETGGCFGNGSVDVIMEALEQRVQELAKLWSDKKRSYLLLFGVQGPNGEFLFPGEVRAFRAYFRNKKKKTEASKSGKMKSIALQERWCALCHADLEESTYSVKDIYAFATFDKKNFLPAGNSKFIDKVFPLCSRCYTLISGGATAVKDKSVLKLGGALSSEKQKEGQGKKEWALSSMEIWVVPEVIGKPAFKQLIQDGKSYLKEGVESEERYLDLLARRDASFVYHFLFVVQNRAQLILHRLIEDVPPSHFRKLQKLWKEVNGRFDLNGKKEKQMGLDTAIRTIAALLMSLAVNRKENKEKLNEEQKVMKENVLTVIASLFQNQLIDVRYYKTLAVSRLTGLFSDEDWIRPKNKEAYDGASQLHSLWMLFEFFTLFNQTIGIEGDDL